MEEVSLHWGCFCSVSSPVDLPVSHGTARGSTLSLHGTWGPTCLSSAHANPRAGCAAGARSRLCGCQ